MGLFFIPPSTPYLENIADFLLKNDKEDLSSYDIYLPSYKACRYLQEILLNKTSKKALILPKITTLYDVNFSIETTEEQSRNNYQDVATIIEQEFVLTKIIQAYSRFNYSYTQALSLSKNLSGLFHELTLNDIVITKLTELYNGDYAEHWLNIQEFLLYAKHEWQQYLNQHNKIDCASQQLFILKEKINSFKANIAQKVIIAGFKPETPHLQELYQVAASSNHIKGILPPICMELVESYWDKAQHHANLQYLANLINYCGISLHDIKLLKPGSQRIEAREKCLFNLFFLAKPSIRLPVEGIQSIQYIPTANQTEESALIAVIIKYLKDYDPRARVAVITQNIKLIDQISVFLKRFALEFERCGPKALYSFKASSYLLLLFKMVEAKFEASATLSFMKHPYFYSPEVFELEKKLFRGPEILGNHNFIVERLKMRGEDKLASWFEEFTVKLYPLVEICENHINNFHSILVTLLKVAENLYPAIWQEENAPLVEYIRDLIEDASLLTNINTNDFSTLFSILLYQKSVECSSNWRPKLFAAKPEEIGLITEIDYVILADLNDESWPKAPSVDPWMGDRMRATLGLEKKSSQIIKDFESFYTVLHCKNVFLTRSLKSGGTETTASRFLLKFLSKLETQNLLRHLEPEIDWFTVVKDMLSTDKILLKEKEVCKAYLKDFPKKLAVTYLELLMRNPHAFYAKKILKLEKLEPIGAEQGPKEFGIFIHDVIEKYCLSYEDLGADKISAIYNIAHEVLRANNISKFTENLWWPKFKNIACEFIEYDEYKRKIGGRVLTEAQGLYKMSIAQNELIITAKADRIEVGYDGSVNIIDFKTGGVPTLKDIETGLSPQLIIEQFILANGGFENIKRFKEIKLTYIKLGSSKPYLKETTVKLKIDIVDFTEDGLRKLLSFFLKDEAIYLSCPNKRYAPQYNDYEHLARNE
jgi:ATP-dependent helicase/nuclease subunit B